MRRFKVCIGMLLLVCLLSAAGCGTSAPAASEPPSQSKKNPVVTMAVKDYGTITIELYPEKAPNTVNNFVSLIQKKFYDGLTFHRIMKGFMVQGGDPAGNGTGGPGYTIRGEFSSNGFSRNDLLHTRGVISMARKSFPLDSAGSQFFIMHADAPSLNGDYAAFGKVLEGMDVVDAIAKVEVADQNGTLRNPEKAPVIERMTVETYGETYPEPEKIQ